MQRDRQKEKQACRANHNDHAGVVAGAVNLT
jgi:hypothetical protein